MQYSSNLEGLSGITSLDGDFLIPRNTALTSFDGLGLATIDGFLSNCWALQR